MRIVSRFYVAPGKGSQTVRRGADRCYAAVTTVGAWITEITIPASGTVTTGTAIFATVTTAANDTACGARAGTVSGDRCITSGTAIAAATSGTTIARLAATSVVAEISSATRPANTTGTALATDRGSKTKGLRVGTESATATLPSHATGSTVTAVAIEAVAIRSAITAVATGSSVTALSGITAHARNRAANAKTTEAGTVDGDTAACGTGCSWGSTVAAPGVSARRTIIRVISPVGA
jgi:hypothetical protein